VAVYDAVLRQSLTIPCDLVVLSTPLVGQADASKLAQMLKVPVDEHGFFLEAHVKLRPLDFATDGIYLCGSARWPSDVGETVAQAYGAAGRASILLGKTEVEVEPIISVVDEEECIGCGLCETVCTYKAIVLQDTEAGRKAQTIPASCKGCGVCAAGCPERAISMQHFTDQQLLAQIDALMAYPVPDMAGEAAV
jgi:heterodisulfide reductase subunit A